MVDNTSGWDYRPERDPATEYVRDHMTYTQIGANSRIKAP